MLRAKLSKNLGANGLTMLLDVRSPESLLDGVLVLGADVEERQLGFTAEGLALEDVREDRCPVDQ
ncbi:hypothetical protein ASG52_25370 [Methylobacterium sp. Leaf456]|uniref:hypothetical protein n=1 Tax=Methylobacterium sp. Leaf456 TaxID=1736382 RepID=UPI0006F40932|nr:hypothetical protein [Methylobacterium sp. Leaf456]KQT53186.1 hypothetical protein ASG52_25370 [Methylobacterium sp. Leaf456]